MTICASETARMEPSLDLFAANIPSDPDVITVVQKELSQMQTLFAVVRNNFQFLSLQHISVVPELEDEPVDVAEGTLVEARRERLLLLDSLRSLSRVLTAFRAVQFVNMDCLGGLAYRAQDGPLETILKDTQ